MRQHGLVIALVVGVILAAARIFLGCAAADPAIEAPAAYAAQQQACIDRYSTRAAIDACRAQVKDAWAIKDAGGEQ